VRFDQHVGMVAAERRLEFVAGKFDQQPERVLEIDRVEDLAVADAGVLDPACVEPFDRLHEHGARDVEGDVVDAAGVGRRAARIGLAVLAGEDGDQSPVAGIEVDVALQRVVEVGLLEHERHAEQALPEVDRGLSVGADQRDVVDALGLQFLH
jgi:hypothetical protein